MKKLLPLAILILIAANARAQTVTENPNEADAEVTTTYSGTVATGTVVTDSGDYQARIGELYAPGGSSYVMPFLLPTLTAGEVITAASLQTQLFAMGNDGTGALADADLYGIGLAATPTLSSSPTPSASYYYQGSADLSNTLLQSAYLTPSSTVRTDANTGPFITTSTSADTELVAYLNAAESEAAVTGGTGPEYVFLRVSYDASTIPAGNNFYALLTDDAGGTNEKPILTLTEGVGVAVPEPSTYALFAAGFGLLVFQMRRRSAATR